MRVVFRCDASIQIGTGHVMRCLTLADALVKNGAECHFICREHEGHLLELIRQRGHYSYSLALNEDIKMDSSEDVKLSHSAWLGATQYEDAQCCIGLLESLQPDWLIVDHYALDAYWEESLRPYCKKLMVIDDLADRAHDCDILLDQNYLPSYQNRYEKLISENTNKLLGPSYALLRDEFRELRRSENNINDRVRPRILINFGGIGNFELLSNVIEVINNVDSFNYYIITGKIKPEEICELRKSIYNSNITMVDHTSEMPKLMIESEYALGATGSTVWERFCLGLNSALVQMASNQSPLLSFLEANDLVDDLGDYRSLSITYLSLFFAKLDLNNEKYSNRKKEIMNLIDGNGTNRVAKVIIEGIKNER